MTGRSTRAPENQPGNASDDLQMQLNHALTFAGSREDDKIRDFEDAETRHRPRKRMKKSDTQSGSKKNQRMPAQFRKVRGKLGLLERLAKDIPLDVIFEIFCHLDPGDLLRLSRTSKNLREILLSKSSQSIWRTARENVQDLPPCPEDLNEPQYARIMFDYSCYVCSRKLRAIDGILWAFRMRCCKNCVPRVFPSYFEPDFVEAQPVEYRKKTDILPSEIYFLNSNAIHQFGSHEVAARLKSQFEVLQTEEDRQAWMKCKSEELKALREHANLCDTWLQARLHQRAFELIDIRKQRKAAILDRLEKVGWREEAEIMYDQFSNHKLVKQSKKLTDYGWNNIKSQLMEMLSNHKTERLARERRRCILARYKTLHKEYDVVLRTSDLREPFPTVGDVLNNRLFHDLIWDTPYDEEILPEFFRLKLLEFLPGIIDEWKPKKIQDLLAIMQRSVPNAITSDMRLASSVFTCSTCCKKVHFPQMFYHRCCTPIRQLNGLGNEQCQTPNSYTPPGPWRPDSLVFNISDIQAMKRLIEACNLDPNTSTIHDLHSADPLIECISCAQDRTPLFSSLRSFIPHFSPLRYFMRWQSMLEHSSCKLKINSFGEEIQAVLASERRYIYYQKMMCCVHCHRQLAEHAMLKHLKDM
ncbi:hypothetical protein GYMLUDRAFT_675937 [Collybiopsis luxurians FD-317 M1]|uniref:F-box domain-containing protein n=1 Tax=Collybiopsis luxurians FD-317 M1 TaxID=944289 RepID=A0A0D0BUU2_9AGAR|nr:hypothetical protein GYMLUDRAFT_675937 [Collybiopsis luxurians FD-317 M1]